MKHTSRILSIYSSDTAGVASMLYELGGMTVIHDASGCNSTYTTHDEPRWYQMDSMVYISALTENDMILGNDEKLVKDVCRTAKELSPAFIALCASPMPAMTGTDLKAVGEEIREKTLLPVFSICTNGMDCYLKGASEALLAYVKHFCREDAQKTGDLSVNILGATPLDFSVNGTVEAVRKFLMEEGFRVVSCMCMGSSPGEIASAGAARVNLVVSSCGLAAAEYFRKKFGTPFVAGVPLGIGYAKRLARELKKAAETGETLYSCLQRNVPGEGEKAPVILHENVFASSLACALEEDLHTRARVIAPKVLTPFLRKEEDPIAECEDTLAELFTKAGTIFADPFYRAIAPGNVPFVSLPHEAFSGRCFRRENKVLAARKIPDWRKKC
ncbi:MAG: oxidoreductase [Lentisphaeria bacterium]|nr:oxidoreductase [Lentisphaeria bacterium]